MFDGIISRVRRTTSTSTIQTDDDGKSLPLPATEKTKWKRRELQLLTAANQISSPAPMSTSQSITGFDNHANVWQSHSLHHPSPSRAGPSQVAWLSSTESVHVVEQPAPAVLAPVPVQRPSISHIHPIGRSVSSPPTSPSYEVSPTDSDSSSSTATPTRWGLKLQTNPSFSTSTHSLRLEPRPHSTDVFGYAYSYPLAKQLSPIAEQDYFSPESLRRTKPLPSGSSPSIAFSYTSPSPNGSHISEITRPSPVYSHPFITRQLNRTISQTSSRTHLSTGSSIPRLSIRSVDPPNLPPLDLRPPFPGPHPSYGGSGSSLRPHRSTITAMPTIAGSSENYVDSSDYGGEDEDMESLHADSFVTASDASSLNPFNDPAMGTDITDENSSTPAEQGSSAGPVSLPSRQNSSRSRLPSASESFISRRWDRDVSLGNGGVVTFRAKRQLLSSTPAFWAFWLGFVCPFLWLIGGWHFTHFGEQPPRLTFWEFYFKPAYWRERCCGGRNKTKTGSETQRGKRKGVADPQLPRWVAEKQSSDDGRARLNDPKRSLRGISFGYPFIPRPVTVQQDTTCLSRAWRRIVFILDKPNRAFDALYGVKLREVRGRPESGRRIFDPWIQRCRYAFCYALILLCIGLCTATSYLIIYNTRQLR